MRKTSPFPGMDPFLEGYLWPDVHNRLINQIADVVGEQIAPKYVARVEIYTVRDKSPSTELGITYPDVSIFKTDKVEEHAAVNYGDKKIKATKPDLILPSEITVRIPWVQIKDVEKNRLVTAIEVLSPVNKNTKGWKSYHKKRKDLHAAEVHLLEIDLLRRGKRHISNTGGTAPHYLFSLWRAGGENIEVWRNFVSEELPILPVPLKSPDPDALLPLKPALEYIYRRGQYSLSIDYGKTPPPPNFSEVEIEWMKKLATE